MRYRYRRSDRRYGFAKTCFELDTWWGKRCWHAGKARWYRNLWRDSNWEMRFVHAGAGRNVVVSNPGPMSWSQLKQMQFLKIGPKKNFFLRRWNFNVSDSSCDLFIASLEAEIRAKWWGPQENIAKLIFSSRIWFLCTTQGLCLTPETYCSLQIVSS